MHGSVRTAAAIALETILTVCPTGRELSRYACRQRFSQMVLAIRQTVGERGSGPTAHIFTRVALAEPKDDGDRATVRSRHQQHFVSLGFEAVGCSPIARHFALRVAPLLEVIL